MIAFFLSAAPLYRRQRNDRSGVLLVGRYMCLRIEGRRECQVHSREYFARIGGRRVHVGVGRKEVPAFHRMTCWDIFAMICSRSLHILGLEHKSVTMFPLFPGGQFPPCGRAELFRGEESTRGEGERSGAAGQCQCNLFEGFNKRDRYRENTLASVR